MYELKRSTFDNYVRDHKNQLIQLARNYKKANGTNAKSTYFTNQQLKYIVEKVLMDQNPVGYFWDGKSFVKIS